MIGLYMYGYFVASIFFVKAFGLVWGNVIATAIFTTAFITLKKLGA